MSTAPVGRSGAGVPLRVAVTTTIHEDTGSRSRPAVFLYTSYITALEQLGLAPVLITPSHSPAAIAALIDVCSGLVLSGGEDVDPARYGAEPSPALGSVVPARDEMEFRALQCALDRDLPILGICRGCQVLNVHFGGTLYQDLDTEWVGDLEHQQSQSWDQRSHTARVEPGSRLHAVVGTEQLFINSFHHQAVKDLGRDLVISARAEDGLVEAIEHASRAWVVGVQWHPERHEASAPDTDPDRRLFLRFREAVAAGAAVVAS